MPSTPKNLAQAYSLRSDIQDADAFAGHRGSGTGAGARWLWSTIKASLTSAFNALYSPVGHTHSSVRSTITQVSHGFSAKQGIYDNGGTWALAKADALATCRGVGVVESIVDANTFVVVFAGQMTATGWAPNSVYYVSAGTAGVLTTVAPTSDEHFLVPVARTGIASTALVAPVEPLPLSLIPDNALQNPVPDAATQAEVEAGVVTALRSYSPARLRQGILAIAPTGSSGSTPTGLSGLFLRAGIASLPTGWIECDGTNGTTDEADIGSMAVVIKHGGTVAAPQFDIAGGTYSSAQVVTISCPTSGVVTKFTLDGSAPSRTNGTVYSTPVSVSATATLKAISYRTPTNPTLTMVDSSVTSVAYTISGGGGGFAITDTPTLLAYLRAQSLSLSDGAAVGSWTDLSGNGNDAGYYYQTSPTFKAAITPGGKAVVRFNGTTDGLAISTLPSGQTAQTWIFALKLNGASDSQIVAGNYAGMKLLTGSGGTHISAYPPSTDFGANLATGFHVLTVKVIDNSNGVIYLDGTQVATFDPLDGCVSSAAFFIGNFNTSSQAAVDFAAILLAGSALGDTDRTNAETAMLADL